MSTDVYSAREIASAAGVPLHQVEALIRSWRLPTIDDPADTESELWRRYVRHADAVDAVSELRGVALFRRAERAKASNAQLAKGDGISRAAPLAGTGILDDSVRPARELFAPPPRPTRGAGFPLAMTSALHVSFVGLAVLMTSIGLNSSSATEGLVHRPPEPLRLVYLKLPGPGGGGGGGGRRQPAPPPKAQRQGIQRVSSPVPPRVPPSRPQPVDRPPVPLSQKPAPPRPIVPASRPPEPAPVLAAERLPAVVAPIVAAPSDSRNVIGALEQSTSPAANRGPGTGGGVGSGTGTGIGPGEGSGIGPGSGGGTGGGLYRPGSGIEAPRLLKEVKPDYTEDGRTRGIEGDVLLEIVVRHDGSVGDIRILKGLGAGLNQRAVLAVRQWRFAPARRLGAPVDVIVEVAVEFTLR